MTDDHAYSPSTMAGLLLAGGGILLVVIAMGYSALLLWHRAITGADTTWFFGSPWLPAAFAVCSVLVVLGSVVLRCKLSRHAKSVAHCLATVAMLFTVTAWAICGIAWMVAGT